MLGLFERPKTQSCRHASETLPSLGLSSDFKFSLLMVCLQTRGSIPFYWSQRPNLRYKPKPQISKTVNHVSSLHADSSEKTNTCCLSSFLKSSCFCRSWMDSRDTLTPRSSSMEDKSLWTWWEQSVSYWFLHLQDHDITSQSNEITVNPHIPICNRLQRLFVLFVLFFHR